MTAQDSTHVKHWQHSKPVLVIIMLCVLQLSLCIQMCTAEFVLLSALPFNCKNETLRLILRWPLTGVGGVGSLISSVFTRQDIIINVSDCYRSPALRDLK